MVRDKLQSHVISTLKSVLMRKRFGFRVEDSHYGLSFWCGDAGYLLYCYENEQGISIAVDSLDELGGLWRVTVFRELIDVSRIPKLKLLGVKIANKVRNRPVWLVSRA